MSQNIIQPYRYVSGCSPSNDFDVLSNWTQSPTGTLAWSSGIPNYARNSCRITSLNWEFSCDPAGSTFTGNASNFGVSFTETPHDKEFFQYCWFLYGTGTDTVYTRYRDSADTAGAQDAFPYALNSIYSIKCVAGEVKFYQDATLKKTSAYDFDPDVNTGAYFSAGQAVQATQAVCTGVQT